MSGLQHGGRMVKVLLAGDCLGRVEALFKRVAAVNASNGPFDVLFCVGGFFAPSGARHHPLLACRLRPAPRTHPCSSAVGGGGRECS